MPLRAFWSQVDLRGYTVIQSFNIRCAFQVLVEIKRQIFQNTELDSNLIYQYA